MTGTTFGVDASGLLGTSRFMLAHDLKGRLGVFHITRLDYIQSERAECGRDMKRTVYTAGRSEVTTVKICAQCYAARMKAFV